MRLSFLAACCKAAYLPALPQHSEAWPGDPLDVVALARRHRVVPLVLRGLPKIARFEAAGTEVLRESRLNAAINLRSLVQCYGLQEAFARAKVPLLFLKGLTLSSLAYGDPLLKASSDIDLLVDPKQIKLAAEILRRLGYAPQHQIAGGGSIEAWHVDVKESEWTASGRLPIDLHTRVADSPSQLSHLTVHSPHQDVPIESDKALQTFARDDLIIYLMAHGASSAWFRLKWLSDVSALLSKLQASEIERLYVRTAHTQCERSTGLGLLLSARVFGTVLPSRLRLELESSAVLRRMVGWCLGQLRNPAEPTRRRFGTATIHACQLLQLSGASAKVGEIRRKLAEARRDRGF